MYEMTCVRCGHKWQAKLVTYVCTNCGNKNIRFDFKGQPPEPVVKDNKES